MSTLVESLRRLYLAGSPNVTKDKIDKMLADGKINQEEHDYILS